MQHKRSDIRSLFQSKGLVFAGGFILILIITTFLLFPLARTKIFNRNRISRTGISSDNSSQWKAPDLNKLGTTIKDNEIRYGHDLIVNTAKFLGPAGIIGPMSNGMNCQNCHLDGGTRAYGNNYSAVASTYPKFRPRSGTIETIEKRVNDCFERSLNGQTLSSASQEMKAIVAYIKWIGTDVKKGETSSKSGLQRLSFMERAASPIKGKIIYQEKCSVCHGKNGEGLHNKQTKEWIYPPLWGDESYNTGAGLYRLSGLAAFVKSNMPLGASFSQPQLTDEEAWDVAAYVNTSVRPAKNFPLDWPDISTKPIDYPFGPFADSFTSEQHKLGPFGPIEEIRKSPDKTKHN